jgi:monomeric isocitrate dehydrogenase
MVVFETGAGGSAPKHVEQLLKKDTTLGFSWRIFSTSLEHLGQSLNNSKRSFYLKL